MSGPFGNTFFGGRGPFYGFEIGNSLRLEDGDSAFLSRTPSSEGNRRTFTLSCWLKRANIPSGEAYIFSAGHTNFNSFGGLEFIGGEIVLQNFNSGTQVIARTGTVLFRDPAAWYNIILAVNTTESTAGDRLKLYVNGTQITAFDGSDSDLTLNYDTQFNNTEQHTFGCRQASSQDAFLDAYLAEVNFIDGTALTPSSFGETKEGIWIPKDTSGLTFGTNGFRLQFKNSAVGTASSSTIGADTSGNDHHFSSTNVATTDNMLDSPTDNHCTLSPIQLAETGVGTFSEGNLKVVLGNTITRNYGTFVIPASGKYYFEATPSDVSGGPRVGISVMRDDGNQPRFVYRSNGAKIVNTSESSYGASYAADDVIGVAINVDDAEIDFLKNNSSQGAFSIDLSLSHGTFMPFVTDGSGAASSTFTFNFGATAFAHTPPSGFVKLSTANLPNPTIDPAQGENPTDYFNTVLYTGNGSTQSITGVNFSPNWTWIKNRSANDAHVFTDSVRGVTKEIQSNAASAESTNADGLTAFGSDGFSLGDDDIYNTNTESYVSWNWLAETTASGSEDGNNPAFSSSSNSEAGFSIVSYTGTGAAGTVAHGAGAVPTMILIKNRDQGDNWAVYHSRVASDPETDYMILNTTAVPADDAAWFNDTAPTSTVFTVNTDHSVNADGEKYIAYVFADVAGYSRAFSYAGNAALDGNFVQLGFRPAWIIIKDISATRSWLVMDSVREPNNVMDKGIFADTSAAEISISTDSATIDILSNGFKCRGRDGVVNTTSETYIGFAIAEQPFKFANAR